MIAEINKSNLNEKIVLEADLAAEKPIYLFLSEKKDLLLYSDSIVELLNHPKLPRPLQVSREGVSFLLQSGVIPPPKTIYENIYILGITHRVEISIHNNELNIRFIDRFSFFNENRKKSRELIPDEDFILDLLAGAVSQRFVVDQPAYFFHSAGKDSNMIALALAKAGWQRKILSVTYKSDKGDDESTYVKKISDYLGFKHEVLSIPDKFGKEIYNSIKDFFYETPLLSLDNATLAYSVMGRQFDFSNSNIIDGTGNDVYLGYIPTKTEFYRQKRFNMLKKFKSITEYLYSENRLRGLTKTRSEWAGIKGFSYRDSREIYSKSRKIFPYWLSLDQDLSTYDYLDLRSYVRGSIIDPEIYARKIRNFADTNNANLIFPWMNQKVAQYFAVMPEQYLFDRSQLKNKLILRKILKERLHLDSDAIGKMGFNFNYWSVLESLQKHVEDEIFNASLWNKNQIRKIYNRLAGCRNASNSKGVTARLLLHRLYLVSIWFNTNKHI